MIVTTKLRYCALLPLVMLTLSSYGAATPGAVERRCIESAQTGSPTADCPDFDTLSVTPNTLNASWAVDWWLPRHRQKLDDLRGRIARHESTDIVFVGDSITQGWENSGQPVWDRYYKKYNALNLGFSGDRTENVLWRLQHGELDGLDPKVAVMLLGTNNTGHRMENPVTTAAGVRRDLDEMQRRLPNAKILILAIFPRDAKPDSAMRMINLGVDKIVSGFADNKKVFFLNINSAFLDADGVLSTDIMPDLLHPNEKGYEIWAKAMEPELQKLLAD